MAIKFRGRRVLVTGAGGLIGANLIPALVELGAVVRATVHHQPPSRPTAAVEYVTCDLTQPRECDRVAAGQQWVFHCAARGASATGFNRGGGIEFLDNFFMDAHLLTAAHGAGAEKFVWLGSTTAYPPTGERPVEEDALFEGEPFEKYYAVGWFKRFTEVLCRMYGERLKQPLPTIVLRPSAVYGPCDDFDPVTAHVIPALIRKVVARLDPLEVWGTGQEERDLVFVGDLVEAMLLAAARCEGHAVCNIGAGQSHTVREVVEALVELDGFVGARIQFDASKPTTIPKRRISIDRAANLLGWQPRTTLAEGLRRTLEWYRQNSP